MSDITDLLDAPREVMFEELAETLDEDALREDLRHAVNARLTTLYDNQDSITVSE